MSVIAKLTRQQIEPMPHQIETVKFMLSHKRAYNLSACGSGKTLPSILAMQILHAGGAEQKILVVAPLSVIRATWQAHMEQFAEDVPLMLLDVSTKRKKQVAALKDFRGMVIINPDGLAGVFHELVAWRPGLVVIDELAGYYRNWSTQRFKAMAALLHVTQAACWAFTGTPITKNILDSYSQCMLVNPAAMPRNRNGRVVSYKQYRDMLCTQPFPDVWVPKPDALARVHEFMQPAIRFTREQVMGSIKTPIRMRKDVPLTQEQQKLLTEMIEKGKAQYGDTVIKGTEARALVTKLVQIATGSVYNTKGDPIEIPCAPRIQALVDLFEEVECTPIIVAAPFIHTIHRLERELKGKGFRVAVIIGEVSMNNRIEIVERFQRGEIDFLLCHPKTLAHGVTLTASSTVCWFGPMYDLELVAQLNDRIFRFGQKGQPLVVEFCSTPAEMRIYAALRNKEQLSGKFLDLFGG